VEAKTTAVTALPQLRLMMQSLLDERFHLKFHRETRELPIYPLSFVKNGMRGPGLTDAPGEPCGPPGPQETTVKRAAPRALWDSQSWPRPHLRTARPDKSVVRPALHAPRADSSG
jgi:uncharacterized protein (TIGR03435 family)